MVSQISTSQININQINKMFDGVCSIKELEQQADDRGIMRQREIVVDEDVPCHLEIKSAGAARNRGEGSLVEANARLFLAAGVEVKPGSKITVRQQGREYDFVSSSLARVYCWHQEIEVCLPEMWA